MALVDEINPVPGALAAAAGRALSSTDETKLAKLLEAQLGGVSELDAHRAGTVYFAGNGSTLLAHEMHYYSPTLDVSDGVGLTTEESKYLAATRSSNPSIVLNGGGARDCSAV